jgi:hypothetical protein
MVPRSKTCSILLFQRGVWFLVFVQSSTLFRFEHFSERPLQELVHSTQKEISYTVPATLAIKVLNQFWWSLEDNPPFFAMHLVSRIFCGAYIRKLFHSTKEVIHLFFVIIVQIQNQQFISSLSVKELFTSLNWFDLIGKIGLPCLWIGHPVLFFLSNLININTCS